MQDVCDIRSYPVLDQSQKNDGWYLPMMYFGSLYYKQCGLCFRLLPKKLSNKWLIVCVSYVTKKFLVHLNMCNQKCLQGKINICRTPVKGYKRVLSKQVTVVVHDPTDISSLISGCIKTFMRGRNACSELIFRCSQPSAHGPMVIKLFPYSTTEHKMYHVHKC